MASFTAVKYKSPHNWMKNILIKVEGMVESASKKIWIRVFILALSVAISAIYTHQSKRSIEKKYENTSERLSVLNEENYELKNDVESLKRNMLILSLADDNFPNPKWIKSVDLMMIKLNKAYEKAYLEPYGMTRDDYIGEYDYDVWPEDVAAGFREGDRMVLEAGTPVTFFEELRMSEKEPYKKVKVTKYPIKVNGVTVGIGGYIDVDYGKQE